MVAKGILGPAHAWQAASIQETSKRCTGALPGPYLGSFWTQNALKPHARLCALRPCPVSCSSLAASHTLARVARVPCLTLFGVGQCRPEKTGYLRGTVPTASSTQCLCSSFLASVCSAQGLICTVHCLVGLGLVPRSAATTHTCTPADTQVGTNINTLQRAT